MEDQTGTKQERKNNQLKTSNEKGSRTEPTEAEVSLGLIAKLVATANKVTTNSKAFISDIDTFKSVYSEQIIEERILDPLLIAVNLKDVNLGTSLEKALSSNEVLMELWTMQVYSDLEEDEAVKALTLEFEKLNKVFTTKSYKSFLKIRE